MPLRHLTTSILLFAAAFVSSVAAQAPDRTKLVQPTVRIPVELSTRHVSVKVYIDGEGPFDFNVDTYASYQACIDQRLAKRLGLVKVRSVRNGDGSGRRVERDLVAVGELRFGGATFTGVEALVDDYSWVKAPDGEPIDGLLGYTLFRELLLEIDYPNRAVILSRGSLPPPSRDDRVLRYRAASISPDVPIHIGDQRIVVGIDTGAQGTLSLGDSYMEELDLEGRPRRAGEARTVYSRADVFVGTLAEDVTIAGHTHEGLRALFSELYGLPLIGHGVLKDYAVAFDQRNGRVRFARPELVKLELEDHVLDAYAGEYEIASGDVRVVTRVGKRLFTERTGGDRYEAFARSETEFYYDFDRTLTIEFFRDDRGVVSHMLLRRPGRRPEHARRITPGPEER